MNKKIKNATPKEFNGIAFLSLLECSMYKKLHAAGLKVEYEPETIVLWEGVKISKIRVFLPFKTRVNGKLKMEPKLRDYTSKLRDITYTPDFVVQKKNYKIYIEAKGYQNDTYPLKRKMFLNYLDKKNDGFTYLFFEPHNIKQLEHTIQLIKQLP